MINFFKHNQFFVILFAIIIVYSSLLTGQPSVNPDAQILLANLSSYKNIGDYFYTLLRLEAIDFQPLRDLTFWIDLFIFKKFSINTFTLQNICWWIACCWVILKIQLKYFPKKEIIVFLFVLAFSVYPLFSFIIPWGMARKHIIAFFFFLLSMNSVLNLTTVNYRSISKISLFYLLSLLGQPIAILFPFWIAYHLIFTKRSSKKEFISILLPNIIIQVTFILINYFYYTKSNIFLYFYGTKFHNGIDLGDSFLALGHYHFQIFFPYLLSFTYGLGDISSILGLVILIITGLYLYKCGRKFVEIIGFILPAFIVFSVILTTPRQLYDTYLLIPTFSYLCLILYLYPPNISRRGFFTFGLIILILSIQSNLESKKWLNYVSLAESSFERRQNCKNAINYARISYEFEQIPNSNVKKFLTLNECLKNLTLTEFDKFSHINFLGNILFYEEMFTLEDKLKKLDELGQTFYTAFFVKAALLIKNQKFSEADNEINKLLIRLRTLKSIKYQFHPITAQVIYPYCHKKKWGECLKLCSKFSSKVKKPYL